MDKFKYVDVPGKNAQVRIMKEIVRRLLFGIFVRFLHLHSEGKVLNGCFTVDNICVPILNEGQDLYVAPYIEVKLDNLQPDVLKPYTDEGGDKDLMKVGWILRNDIFSTETELPSDLNQLLGLLSSDNPIKNKNLIFNHVCLMGPRDQVSYYLWLYKRLMYLKKKIPGSYQNIMQNLETTEKDGRKTTEKDGRSWKDKAKENKFLPKLSSFERCTDDYEGLSRFYRNSVEHLFEMFGEEELEDYHIVYILTESFPAFLSDLQRAFYEEGKLQTFQH